MDWGKIKSRFAEIAKGKLPGYIATGGEWIALYFWLIFFDQGSYLLATAVLWAGFLVERLSVWVWINFSFGDRLELPGDDKPGWEKLLGLFVICLSEILFWMIFVGVYDYFGMVPAFVVIFVGEQVQHSVELAVLADRNWKDFLFTRKASTITLFEALGGITWIYMARHGQPQIGGLLLLAGLTIEHKLQGNAIKENFLRRIAASEAAEKGSEKSSEKSSGRKSKKSAKPVPQA